LEYENVYRGGISLKEAISAHNLRGISLIGDLYILMGMGLIIAGGFLLVANFIGGFVFVGLGILLAAIGHYLDDLEPWAWWGAILGNLSSGSSVFIIISGSPLTIALSVVYYLLGAALTIAISIFLLRPSVRELFFKHENK
jgi:hypothetical protein